MSSNSFGRSRSTVHCVVAALFSVAIVGVSTQVDAGRTCDPTASCPPTCDKDFHPTPDTTVTKTLEVFPGQGLYGGCTRCGGSCEYGACYGREVDAQGNPVVGGSGGYCRPNGCH